MSERNHPNIESGAERADSADAGDAVHTRVQLATANATITALSAKLDVADAEIKQLRQRMHDALNHISEIKAILNMRKSERK